MRTFADKMNGMPKHVATTTRSELGWNAAPLSGRRHRAEEGRRRSHPRRRQQHAGAHAARPRLVDELRLMVFPVAIGGGLRVFPEDRGKVALKLTDLVRYDSGVLLQVYRSVSAEHVEAGVRWTAQRARSVAAARR